jgi:hypothetical protein
MRGTVCPLVALIAVPVLAAGSITQAARAQEKVVKPADASRADEVKLVEIVPGLPDFPSTVMASSEERGPEKGWAHSWKRETRTTASFDDVRKFYLDQFEKKGWKVTMTKEKPGKSEWSLSKGQAWARVALDGGSAGLVKITAEWKTH